MSGASLQDLWHQVTWDSDAENSLVPRPFEGRRRKGLVHTVCTCSVYLPFDLNSVGKLKTVRVSSKTSRKLKELRHIDQRRTALTPIRVGRI